MGLALSAPAFGTTISIGNLTLLADSPTLGLQELTVNNLTGSNCSADFAACTNLNFTAWTLTVNYTSSFYSGPGNTGAGPSEPNPFIATSATFGDITPSSSNNLFDFDLCGGVNINNGCTPATVIASVEFKGKISPTSFCLFDATANGCPAVNPTTFFADASFDLVWDGNSDQPPAVDETANIFTTSPNIVVHDQTTVPTIPEPGTLVLLTALLPFARLVRRRPKRTS